MQSDCAMKPKRQTVGSAGYDFYLPMDLDMVPGKTYTIGTGVHLTDEDVPAGYDGRWFMMLVPRSGLGVRHGLRLVNTVGIIDSDYRDEIIATITVDVPTRLVAGSRFMQGIIIPYLVLEGEDEPWSVRNGGHGSTGN